MRVWARADDDELLGRSAQLSYYFLLALFPLLLFLITLFGYFNGAGSHLRRRLIAYLGDVMPASAKNERMPEQPLMPIIQPRAGACEKSPDPVA